MPAPEMTTVPLASFPPIESWDDWAELDPAAWPRKVEKRYVLVPTTCFNCEAACGLVAYVDRATMQVAKLEGNPYHAGSRGRNCAKGPATINQIEDPGRILHPMRRVGPRGSGKWERVSWDAALDDLAGRIRAAIVEDRKQEVMYHVGRPGHDGYMDRVLRSWGVDGHNSHTNVCSSAARLGYALWSGSDRPSPDHANAKFILMLSAHLETGHYFNPHAQRIVEGMRDGAKLCVIDVRLSNTASRADWWLSPWPGTEALLLLGIAHVLLEEDLFDRAFVERWTNWRAFLADHLGLAADEVSFDRFVEELRRHYAYAAPEEIAERVGVDAAQLREIAREIGRAGSALATHVWRSAAAGNLGGWQVARCLQFIVVLMGAVGAKGGTNPNSRNKFVPPPFLSPPPVDDWNEILYPRDWPLAYHEMSFLLPHLLERDDRRIDVYFTRVYNPVWTNPDGLAWERMLSDERRIGVHAALTPVWSETAQYADYVLPMGNAAERHDLMSTETHAARWLGFRQPVQRVAMERLGTPVGLTYEANPGEVWEEDEFWIELSWRIDLDGSLGIRKWYESPYRPGAKITVDEYYRWIFENSVPGLPEEAARHGLDPLAYMRRYGAFLVEKEAYGGHAAPLDPGIAGEASRESDGTLRRAGKAIGIETEGAARVGFPTPSRRLELYSPTMVAWGWPEQALPGWIESHVHHERLDRAGGEMVLVPTFRLPTLIHTRSANAKWLYELSNSNPAWIHPEDAERIGVAVGDLVRIATRLGWFVNRAWVTEAIRPGVVAVSHHLGRWRLHDAGTDRWASATVVREEADGGRVRFRRVADVGPFLSDDPDSSRVWWTDGGVHQNMTFAVQPDPISGMHCWHQRVRVTRPEPGDRYGDVVVDPAESRRAFEEWTALTRPAPGPDGLRRPLWFARALRPTDDAYVIRD